MESAVPKEKINKKSNLAPCGHLNIWELSIVKIKKNIKPNPQIYTTKT